ncbi:MAG: flavin reductase family protein, partial [Acidobacteriia bacterium]|nr:flavin reductase family protein [Terriglobia bacterium]
MTMEKLAIDPAEQVPQNNYKLLIGSVVPRPIAFVSTISPDGILNLAPFSFFNAVCGNPP